MEIESIFEADPSLFYYRSVPLLDQIATADKPEHSDLAKAFPICRKIFKQLNLTTKEISGYGKIKSWLYYSHPNIFSFTHPDLITKLVAKKVFSSISIHVVYNLAVDFDFADHFILKDQLLKISENDLRTITHEGFYSNLAYYLIQNKEWTQLRIEHHGIISRQSAEFLYSLNIQPRPLDVVYFIKRCQYLGFHFDKADQSYPLHIAVIARRLDLCKKIIQSTLVDALDHAGHTSLQIAALHGEKEIIKELLDQGAKVDYAPTSTSSPMLQVLYGHFTEEKKLCLLQLLVQYGADVNQRSSNNACCALEIAAYQHLLSICRFLLEKGAKLSTTESKLFFFSALKGHYSLEAKTFLKSYTTDLHCQAAVELLRRKLIAHLFWFNGRTHCEVTKTFHSLESMESYYCPKKILKALIPFAKTSHYSKLIMKRLYKALKKALNRLSHEAQLKAYHKQNLMIIFGGYDSHLVTFMFYGSYLILINRGGANRNQKSFEILKFDPQYLDAHTLTLLTKPPLRTKDSYLKKLDQALKHLHCQKSPFEEQLEDLLNLPLQTVGNCSLANSEPLALLFFVFYKGIDCRVFEKDSSVINEMIAKQKKRYADWLLFLKEDAVDSYLDKKIKQMACEKFIGYDYQLIFQALYQLQSFIPNAQEKYLDRLQNIYHYQKNRHQKTQQTCEAPLIATAGLHQEA